VVGRQEKRKRLENGSSSWRKAVRSNRGGNWKRTDSLTTCAEGWSSREPLVGRRGGKKKNKKGHFAWGRRMGTRIGPGYKREGKHVNGKKHIKPQSKGKDGRVTKKEKKIKETTYLRAKIGGGEVCLGWDQKGPFQDAKETWGGGKSEAKRGGRSHDFSTKFKKKGVSDVRTRGGEDGLQNRFFDRGRGGSIPVLKGEPKVVGRHWVGRDQKGVFREIASTEKKKKQNMFIKQERKRGSRQKTDGEKGKIGNILNCRWRRKFVNLQGRKEVERRPATKTVRLGGKKKL